MNQIMKFSILVLALFLVSCKDEPVTETPIDNNTTDEAFLQKVLVEKVASVNCGSCSLAQWELEQLKDSLGDRFVYISNYLFGPLNHSHTDYLLEKADKTYFTPLAFVNRKEEGQGTVFYQLYAWEEQVTAVLSQKADLGIGLSTSYQEEFINVNVLLSRKDLLGTDNRLHVFLLEKKVVGEGDGYDQRNYGNDDPEHPYYQQGEEIAGFEHKNILRSRLTDKDGYLIEWRENDISVELSSAFTLADNKSLEDYSLVAFVADGEIPNAGIILNTQQVSLGDSASMFE